MLRFVFARGRSFSSSPSAAPPPAPFSKLLVANRGEIACRIMRTARALGLRTVAVYSDADAGAAHVGMADEAVRVGPAEGPQSYLRPERIVAAALRTGAGAVHPGYGFLSENADFAAAVTAAGISFVGPPASAIRSMGSKAAAKDVMIRAGVPVTPGYWGEDSSVTRFAEEAAKIGYPVMLKAVRGGGGKGMRIVHTPGDLADALDACRREAATSFGSSAVLVEKYLPRPRHIEFQVLADMHGDAVHLHERDCSVQRRHQKVLEEAPAPFLPTAVRDAMGRAAVDAAKAVGYVGAGTVEFMVDVDALARRSANPFYFMEMNCRLQVEHPVTEMILGGLDLVELQLRIARGERLPFSQADVARRLVGHAVEARVCAENPSRNFLPATGVLKHLVQPPASRANVPTADFAAAAGVERGPGVSGHGVGALPYVRVDTGVRTGDAVSVYYDSMISKLIAWGPDRPTALAALRTALAQYQIVGLPNNVAFLERVVAHPLFAAGGVDTSFLSQHLAECLLPSPLPPAPAPVVVIAALATALARSSPPSSVAKGPSSPWIPGGTSLSSPMQPGANTLSLSFFEAEDTDAPARPQRAVQLTPCGAQTFGVSLEGLSLTATGSLTPLAYSTSSSSALARASAVSHNVKDTSVFTFVGSCARTADGTDAPAVVLRATVVFTRARCGGTEVHVFPDDAHLVASPLVFAADASAIAAAESASSPPLSAFCLLLPAAPYGRAGSSAVRGAQRIIAPMPGKVVQVLVKPGALRPALLPPPFRISSCWHSHALSTAPSPT